ncbi:hypothetical protein OF83DRAFT_1083183 [Amylostereum chailletii]|nr:hypothetical protein OF83DRAFT_1083183 [Amylostereum chailletii]
MSAAAENLSLFQLQGGAEHSTTLQSQEDVHLVTAMRGLHVGVGRLQLVLFPSSVWDHLFDELQPDSRVALASTCRLFRQWNHRVYEVIIFRSNKSLRQLLHSVSCLVSVLVENSMYSEAVRKIDVQGWSSRNTDDDLIRLDEALAAFLACTPALETLVLSLRQLAVPPLTRHLHDSFLHGRLGHIRRLSIDGKLFLNIVNTCLTGLSLSGMTSIRLVVNYYDQWMEGFTPCYIHTIGAFVPKLEELVLDQTGMSKACMLPGDLHEWAASFRSIPHLQRLVLASLFVINMHAEWLREDDGYDNMVVDSEDENVSPMEMVEDDDYCSTFNYNLCMLAAWTDAFFDEHLRLPPPFSEIWFFGIDLLPNSPGHTVGGSVGYRQKITHEREGEKDIVHFIITPAPTRSSWWWDRLDL